MKQLTSFKAVKGKNLTKVEVASWSPEKMMAYLSFAEFFMKKKDGKVTYDITMDKRKSMESIADATQTEFLARIDAPTWVPTATRGKFLFKLATSLRVLLGWLKNNPFLITDELREKMKANERFSWALEPFKVTKTNMGLDVIEPNTEDGTEPSTSYGANTQATRLEKPEVQYNKALLQMSSIFQNLVKNIKVSDLKDLKTENKLKLAIAMAPVLAKSFSQYKPNKLVMNQININGARREELEKMALNFHNRD